MITQQMFETMLSVLFEEHSKGKLTVKRIIQSTEAEEDCRQGEKTFASFAELTYQPDVTSEPTEIWYRFPQISSEGTFIINGREMNVTLQAFQKQKDSTDDTKATGEGDLLNEQANQKESFDLKNFTLFPATLWHLQQVLRRIFGGNKKLPSASFLEGCLNRTFYLELTPIEITNRLIQKAESRKVFFPVKKGRVSKESRYVHDSHKRKLCPLETPESMEIGLRLFLAQDAKLELIEDGKKGLRIIGNETDEFLSLSSLLVPFIHHNDGARAMMGGKNLKQALPLEEPEEPLIKTGREKLVEGNLSLGKNVLVAYLPFFGYNIDDGIVVSQSMANRFTSRHSYQFELEVARYEQLKEIKIQEGKEINFGDVLAVKHTVEGNQIELKYEKRFPAKVVSVVEKQTKVEICVEAFRTLEVGDKLTGRHGNKGVVTLILPDSKMPFFRVENKEYKIEVLLSPMSVVSRMNLGQLLETHYGWLAKHQQIDNAEIGAPFQQIDTDELARKLTENNLPEGKAEVFLPVGNELRNLGKVTVGYQYLCRLNHLARDKFHVRTCGNQYSIVTEQPLKGKRFGGGQRFGEMEFWALWAHAADELRKEFTVLKSDNPKARNDLIKKIADVNGLPIELKQGFSETLRAFQFFLQGLNLELTFLTDKDKAAKTAEGISRVALKVASPQNVREWTKGKLSYQNLLDYLIDGDKAQIQFLKKKFSAKFQDALNTAYYVPFQHGWVADAINRINLFNTLESEITKLKNSSDSIYDEQKFKQFKNIEFHPDLSEKDNTVLLDDVILGKQQRIFRPAELEDSIIFGKSREEQRCWMGLIELAEPIPHPLFFPNELRYLRYKKLKAAKKEKKKLQKATVEDYEIWEKKKNEWMKKNSDKVISVLPVLPLAFRPTTANNIEHPLTTLYKKVLIANSKLADSNKQSQPHYHLMSKFGLYKAVENLFLGKNTYGGKKQSSLMNYLEGKYGLLRHGLLGKRQDYSARAVIVPDPKLKLDECGLPLEILVIWFENAVKAKLDIEDSKTNSNNIFIQALRGNKAARQQLKIAVEKVITENDLLILLNRQPTLHRYNVLAFKPKLREDYVIAIPPMVCGGFNADFDGDTMAVYLPVTKKTQEEARKLLPTNHLFSAANGHLMLSLGQDYALGKFLLNQSPKGQEKLKEVFGENADCDSNLAEAVSLMLRETDEPKQQTEKLLAMQNLMFATSSCGAASFSYFDIKQLSFDYSDNCLSNTKLLEPLTVEENSSEEAAGRNESIEKNVAEIIKANPQNLFGRYFLSGARGDIKQFRQIFGAVGYAFDGYGKPRPAITNCFASGLSRVEYWNLCHSTRRTMIDKKLGVGEAGALTRDLVEAAYELRIVTEDCETTEGLYIGHLSLPGLEKREKTTSDLFRSPLTCQAADGICQLCYGRELSGEEFPAIGFMVGVLAGESIGERGTQLSMQTFHTGAIGVSLDNVKKIFRFPESEFKDASELFDEIIAGILVKAYSGKIAPIHFEVILKAMWQKNDEGKLKGCPKLALDWQRRKFLAAASYQKTKNILRKTIEASDGIDNLESPKSWLIVGGR